MGVKYKQKCFKCKKNFVVMTYSNKFALCYDCQKDELIGKIKNPEMKKMFDVPEDFYKENSFLRNIKINYLKYGELTEKQIKAFKKTVATMKGERSEQKEEK